MSKRFFDSEKFKDKWYRKLSPTQKCIWEFAISECNHAGILELDLDYMSFCIGTEIKNEDFEIFDEKFIFIRDDLIFIPNFVLFQQKVNSLEELNPLNKVHKSILAELKKYNLEKFYAPCLPLDSPLLGAKVKVKVIGNSKGNSKGKEIENNYINLEEKTQTREDPYISPVIDCFIKEYKNIFSNSPPLGKEQREKILELNREVEDFKETLPKILKDLKRLNFKKIGYNPDVIWLLRNNNYLSLKSGEYNAQLEEENNETNNQLIEKLKQRYANG